MTSNRAFLWAVLFCLLILLGLCLQTPAYSADKNVGGELLYNGIRLPAQWPPKNKDSEYEPMTVPYLKTPPQVIPIDIGRQLFVDDFLIEQRTLLRSYHHAQYHPANPVLKGDKRWERQNNVSIAMPFSGGVWYDPQDRLFKMWYNSHEGATCYAISQDGIHWEKPALDVRLGTNIVCFSTTLDSSTVWLDLEEKDPQRRYKMFFSKFVEPPGCEHWSCREWYLALCFSPDGIHWTEPVDLSELTLPNPDRTTVFYNPFRDVWVYSLREFRHPGTGKRARSYREHADVTVPWRSEETVPWTGADRLDPHHPNPEFSHIEPQLYNLDGVAYESLMLGLFSIWQGPENGECNKLGIRKRNEVMLGFSRDGFHWYRPDRRPFIGVNEEIPDAWNWGNVQSVGGGCLVVGDKLYFYVSGRSLDGNPSRRGGSTGLTILRRDGFASVYAGDREGMLTTRPVRFSGRYLFVNADTDRGELRIEILDKDGKLIAPFTKENCAPISVDSTLQAVRWESAEDLSGLAGKPVRFRFHLKNGSLYSFWVSAGKSGASYGYVAAGGPGFTGPTDTVGSTAYKSSR